MSTTTSFNMDWGDVQTGSSKQADFMKLKDGVNLLRIVSKPSQLALHWEATTDGQRKKILCTGSSDCILCEHGSRATRRFQFLVIDKNENWDAQKQEYTGEPKVKIFETGASVVKQIQDYANDVEYGDPEKYDIRIKKEGTGKDTRYSVLPSRNSSELTDVEKKAVEEAPTIESLNKIPSKSEILDMHLAILQGVGNDSSAPSSKSTEDDGWGDDFDNF